MSPIGYLLFSLHTLMIQPVPAGTQLQVRLTNSIGSFSSHVGNPVNAILIAPVMLDGREVLSPGLTFSGEITSVARVGYGLRHETASMRLDFDQLILPDGEKLSIASRLAQVDNSREKVNSSGLIQGIRSTGSISYRVSGYVRTALLWDVHAQMAEWAIRSLLVALPEPEIYYPAGTELRINLTRDLPVIAPAEADDASEALSEDELSDLRGLVGRMPIRTQDPENHRPSDLTNVLLIGSRDEISTAFRAAGWTEAGPDSIRSRIRCIRAAAEVHGFQGAPMTPLLLQGAEADMSWQKSLNDVAKRHHIRIWKQPGTWNGQELWMAAATRDVDFAYMRPGRYFTHEIDSRVDEEREKVVNDLTFTSCAQPLIWAVRQGTPRLTRNGTGDRIGTDTRMVVLQLNECPTPRMATESDGGEALVARGGRWQRFFRREVLVARSDVLRTNIYYRSYELSKWAVEYVRYRRRKASETRSLQATYGPAGSSPPVAPHQSGLAIQAFR
jgi:hypothetical protein